MSDIKTPSSFYRCKINHCGVKWTTVDVIGTNHCNIQVKSSQLCRSRESSGKRRYQIGDTVHVLTTASNDNVAAWWVAKVVYEFEDGKLYEVRWPEDALDADQRRYSTVSVQCMRMANNIKQ